MEADVKKRILLIEDSQSLASLYQSYLEAGGYMIVTVETGRDAIVQILREPPDVVLLDLKLPDMDGMDILRRIQQDDLPCTVIVMTAHGSIDIAVNAMQYGAFDFLVKPFDARRLQVTVKNALANNNLVKEVQGYREQFARRHYEGFIGESLPMQGVYRIIDCAAPSNATVFITGESGVGKEVCAEAIHNRSPRKQGPFVPLNCGAIPKDLMESEIFGHVKGAYTGALNNRDGAATQAHRGTLFLDEICEMDLELQTKLLRFIQTGTFQRVGGSQQETVDVRFVCATNRDPLKEVQAGRFREDLYYRLHVIPIYLPPLRERETDIKLLMESFLREYAKQEKKRFTRFTPEAVNIMMAHHWPGNVRELQNVIRNIVVLNNDEAVTPDMIPFHTASMASPLLQRPSAPHLEQPVSPEAGQEDFPIKPLWLIEKEAIEQAITYCGGNIPKAAAMLDVSASTIYRKKEKWEQEL
ncbi:response regulator [Hahella sp. KA22]|nr:sigma-54-dependent Fis family transcriptional regulator [Hahella sp. KA22]QAY56220.1 response regulator [Hahella sp. KA22]